MGDLRASASSLAARGSGRRRCLFRQEHFQQKSDPVLRPKPQAGASAAESKTGAKHRNCDKSEKLERSAQGPATASCHRRLEAPGQGRSHEGGGG